MKPASTIQHHTNHRLSGGTLHSKLHVPFSTGTWELFKSAHLPEPDGVSRSFPWSGRATGPLAPKMVAKGGALAIVCTGAG